MIVCPVKNCGRKCKDVNSLRMHLFKDHYRRHLACTLADLALLIRAQPLKFVKPVKLPEPNVKVAETENDLGDVAALRGMMSNPIYAGLGPYPRLISDDDWIRVAVMEIEELGPEQFLVNLLFVLRDAIGDYETFYQEWESKKHKFSGEGKVRKREVAKLTAEISEAIGQHIKLCPLFPSEIIKALENNYEITVEARELARKPKEASA